MLWRAQKGMRRYSGNSALCFTDTVISTFWVKG